MANKSHQKPRIGHGGLAMRGCQQGLIVATCFCLSIDYHYLETISPKRIG